MSIHRSVSLSIVNLSVYLFVPFVEFVQRVFAASARRITKGDIF